MARQYEKLPSIANVAPGNQVTLNCPPGPTYDQITFKLTNVTPADLSDVKVILGSKNQWEVRSAATIAKVNAYYKRPEKAGYLTLWFYRPEMKTEEERSATSIGTQVTDGGVNFGTLTVQFTIADTVTNPKIEAYRVVRAPRPFLIMTKLREYPRNFATAGEQDIDNIPRQGARINAIHLFKPDVSHVKFEVNNGRTTGRPVDMPKDMIELMQEQYGRAPMSADATTVDLNLLSKLNGPMPTAGLVDMRLKPTIDSSGGVSLLVEYQDSFDGI